jgi:hypothetical protein
MDNGALARLKLRFAHEWTDGGKVPQVVFNRLIDWLARGFSYGQLAQWPEHVAAVTSNDVDDLTSGLAGPGKIVTGIMEPRPKESTQ